MFRTKQMTSAKRTAVLIASLVLACAPLRARDAQPPDELLATLAREASAVVRVQVTDAKTERDGIYTEQIVECRIVESYKGVLRAGEPLRYSVRSETGLERQAQGERIVFLSRRSGDGATRWAALETGEFDHDARLAARVRRFAAERKLTKFKRKGDER